MTKIFRLYIDESGDHSYGKRELKKLQLKTKEGIIDFSRDYYPELHKPDKRYLGITGCIIEKEMYQSAFHPKMEKLKKRHFTFDIDDPLIFHREDIINKRGRFWRLRDSEKESYFNSDLLTFFRDMDYTVIAVVIDKKTHIERYQAFAYHPYHFCLAAILERYCGLLHFYNARGDVMAESRGGSEDKQLKEAYRKIYEGGTQFRHSDFFQGVLTSKEIKIKSKAANIAGLQLSDLLAHPLKQQILKENGRLPDSEVETFGNKVCDAVENKLNRHVYSGEIYGYGKVFIK